MPSHLDMTAAEHRDRIGPREECAICRDLLEEIADRVDATSRRPERPLSEYGMGERQ